MDLETENRLAALLMEEARRLRAEADREGVGVYLRQPNVRGRPNSRFLTATVLGVEQANRVVQVNEMWRLREKELELEGKTKSRSKDKDMRHGDKGHSDSNVKVSSCSRRGMEACGSSVFPSSGKRGYDDPSDHSGDEDGLRDDEVEEFLRSRAKRGRGAVGSRMDEPGPYPSATSSDYATEKVYSQMREKEEWEHRILGPEKPSFIKSHNSPPDKVCLKREHHTKERMKQKSREETSERRKDKEEKKRKKKCKHRHHKSRRRSRSGAE